MAGQVVSSQAYVDDQNNNVEENSAEAVDDDEPAIVSSEEDREVEWKVTWSLERFKHLD